MTDFAAVAGEATNAAWLERDNAHVLHSLHNPEAHLAGNAWVRGEGTYLIDAEGRRHLDAMSGLWNVTLGHGRSELIEAASRQMATLAYCSGYAGNANTRATELAEKLAQIAYPSINRFFFTSGGGESTDTTIKIARSYWKSAGKPGKVKTLAMTGGYHGTTMAAMCATGLPAYWPAFEPRMPGFAHVPLHHRHVRAAPAGSDAGRLAADDLERTILAEGPETVALFLIEPVMGGGAYVAPEGYFRHVREICDRYDVLLAVDEVITGFGRTGEMFALTHWGVEPDLMQFAKGITSGYFPLGGVGVSDRVAGMFASSANLPWMHCYTYSGHPVGCAVALATIGVLEREGLPARAGRLGRRLKERLEKGLGQTPHAGEIRGLGLILAVDLLEDPATEKPFDPARKAGATVLAACRKAGLVTRGRGDTIYLGPPLTASEAEVDRIADIVIEAAASLGAAP